MILQLSRVIQRKGIEHAIELVHDLKDPRYELVISHETGDEGFGNAFLEAIYFRKPMLVNRYATFVRDIEPKGFDLIVMDGFLTKKTVQKVREIIESPEKKATMVNHNYEIATRYYSYSVLRKSLNSLFINFFGIEA